MDGGLYYLGRSMMNLQSRPQELQRITFELASPVREDIYLA